MSLLLQSIAGWIVPEYKSDQHLHLLSVSDYFNRIIYIYKKRPGDCKQHKVDLFVIVMDAGLKADRALKKVTGKMDQTFA